MLAQGALDACATISKSCIVHHKYTNSFGAADRGAAIANKLVALGADVLFEAGGYTGAHSTLESAIVLSRCFVALCPGAAHFGTTVDSTVACGRGLRNHCCLKP